VVLDTIQRVLSLAASLALITGVLVALLQLRNQQRLRELEIVMRLYSTFGEENFVRHFRRVSGWQYETYAAYQQRSDPEDYISLMVVSVFFENMGLLLKREFAPITLLDDLLSGPVLHAWPKVAPVWAGLREEHSQPSWAEWFEFFHDAMRRRMTRST
jgi:hypothetical protein